jgi:hypothetical protein
MLAWGIAVTVELIGNPLVLDLYLTLYISRLVLDYWLFLHIFVFHFTRLLLRRLFHLLYVAVAHLLLQRLLLGFLGGGFARASDDR